MHCQIFMPRNQFSQTGKSYLFIAQAYKYQLIKDHPPKIEALPEDYDIVPSHCQLDQSNRHPIHETIHYNQEEDTLHNEKMMEMLSANVTSIMDSILVEEQENLCENLRLVQETQSSVPDQKNISHVLETLKSCLPEGISLEKFIAILYSRMVLKRDDSINVTMDQEAGENIQLNYGQIESERIYGLDYFKQSLEQYPELQAKVQASSEIIRIYIDGGYSAPKMQEAIKPYCIGLPVQTMMAVIIKTTYRSLESYIYSECKKNIVALEVNDTLMLYAPLFQPTQVLTEKTASLWMIFMKMVFDLPTRRVTEKEVLSLYVELLSVIKQFKSQIASEEGQKEESQLTRITKVATTGSNSNDNNTTDKVMRKHYGPRKPREQAFVDEGSTAHQIWNDSMEIDLINSYIKHKRLCLVRDDLNNLFSTPKLKFNDSIIKSKFERIIRRALKRVEIDNREANPHDTNTFMTCDRDNKIIMRSGAAVHARVVLLRYFLSERPTREALFKVIQTIYEAMKNVRRVEEGKTEEADRKKRRHPSPVIQDQLSEDEEDGGRSSKKSNKSKQNSSYEKQGYQAKAENNQGKKYIQNVNNNNQANTPNRQSTNLNATRVNSYKLSQPSGNYSGRGQTLNSNIYNDASRMYNKKK